MKWFDPNALKAQDSWAFEEFFVNNYSLVNFQDSEVDGRCVLDIGANKGYFSMRTVMAGAKMVVAVEPDLEAFELLRDNVKDIPEVMPLNASVFDGIQRWTMIAKTEDGDNSNSKTGKISAQPDGVKADKVHSVSIGNLLGFFPPKDNSLVLKVDTEGAEYDILLSSSAQDIRRFEWIYLEVHPQSEWLESHPARNKEFLLNYMTLMGYEVAHQGAFVWYTYDPAGNIVDCKPIDDLQCYKLRRVDA
jgi:FkbM family methyltransferase